MNICYESNNVGRTILEEKVLALLLENTVLVFKKVSKTVDITSSSSNSLLRFQTNR